ncbi:MAG: transcription termination factor Rho [Candidatus Ancillula sp.]|jgi:transcription termination factor Rho|nr:transcription termination factor Rho [Candidatus Ancillula sp.]
MPLNDIASMKLFELKELAHSRGVDIKGLKKREIIEALSTSNQQVNEENSNKSLKSSFSKRGSFKSKDGDQTSKVHVKNQKKQQQDETVDDDHGQVQTKTTEHSTEPDDLIQVGGIFDQNEAFGFMRTAGYLPSVNDVYVSISVIKRCGLRPGDAVVGTIRESSIPRGSQPKGRPVRYTPIYSIESINGLSIDEASQRPRFEKLTPLYPQERLPMEFAKSSSATNSARLTGRVIDLVSPIGKGQRGLIVAPPKAGKTITMQHIANAISENNPEVYLMVLLVDERPEEVTDMQRSVKGEVISSTFDRPPSDHTQVAELAIERAKRLVELNYDVVILLDSITRLARAYNVVAPTSGRILSGGVDANALYPPKKFLGAARNIENGGSLTIIASALVETGSKMDEVIFEEFKGTGNMELKLSRQLADKRIFPAIDVNASGTRREEYLIPENELKVVYRLRHLLGGLDQQPALELILQKMKETGTNLEFLHVVQQATPEDRTS